MTPDQARAMYRRQVRAHGETITLRRGVGAGAVEASIRARVTGYDPQELASGIDQGERKLIVLAEDVEAAIAAGDWPAPAAGAPAISKNDRAVVRSRPMVVQDVDDSTRRVGGVLVAYEIRASGS